MEVNSTWLITFELANQRAPGEKHYSLVWYILIKDMFYIIFLFFIFTTASIDPTQGHLLRCILLLLLWWCLQKPTGIKDRTLGIASVPKTLSI